MNTSFGISSAESSNKRLKNGYTFFDWVMRQKGFPDFWCRTLLGENPISQDEIEFLKSKDCKIALVMRDLTENIVSSSDGSADGARAADAAASLGIPEGTFILAEINDDWSVNHNWMISFAQTVVSMGYTPGFIGNTDSSKNFNFDRQCSHYAQATENENQYNAVYCATEPKCVDEPDDWTPYCPSALQPEDMELWMTGDISFNDISADVVYAKTKEILNKMF